ncbi:MAG: glycoside hydrolase [Pseudonocardiales bacterium]|nr:MAG: glycoside hydrolase [Pseudonocardiales bacterium]
MVTAAQEAETAHKAAAGVLQQLTVQAPARRAKALAAQRGAAPSAVDLTLAADAGHIVYDKNFPDPGVLKVGNTYYAYGTNSPDANVQLLTSTDLEHWTEAGNALPQVGPWARSGRTWAPEVMPLPNGQFAMFYTAQSAATGHQAVGVAVANGPAGPFVDNSPQPLLSGAGDTLDASPFRSPIDGRMYVQWKDGATATILSQQLSPDGLQVTGPQVPLLSNDQPWQSNIVEAPQMHVHDGQHYLFYSGNSFDNPGYGVGYAMCDGPLGPCRDAPENPILHQKGDALGPGHSTLITDSNGDDRLLYHAWHPDALNGPPGRVLWLDRVEWVNGKPVVRGPAG